MHPHHHRALQCAAHASTRHARLQDGICIPQTEQEGCGTHGKPPCSENLVNEWGTITLLDSPNDGDPWEAFPVMQAADGCLTSCAPVALIAHGTGLGSGDS